MGRKVLSKCFLHAKHESKMLCRGNSAPKISTPSASKERKLCSRNCSMLSSDVWESVCFD